MKRKCIAIITILCLWVSGMCIACSDDDDDDTVALDGRTIKLTDSEINLVFGDETQSSKKLKHTVTPVGVEVKWSSSNESIVIVNERGVVAAVAPGAASVTAATGTAFATATVIVTKAKPAAAGTIVTFKNGDTDVTKGVSIAAGNTITVSTELVDTTDIITAWKSKDDSIATVSGTENTCVITGVSEGETTILLTTSSGVELTTGLSVTVTAAPTP